MAISVLYMLYGHFFFQNLTDDSHLIRSNCLHLIGCLESHDQATKGDNDDEVDVNAQKLLEKFLKDQDSRVRSSAFEAIVSELCHGKRGLKDTSVHPKLLTLFPYDKLWTLPN